jgi:hypothetical protein
VIKSILNCNPRVITFVPRLILKNASRQNHNKLFTLNI